MSSVTGLCPKCKCEVNVRSVNGKPSAVCPACNSPLVGVKADTKES